MTASRGGADGAPAGGAMDGDLARVLSRTAAVVDAVAAGPTAGRVAAWHVDVGPDTGQARPCGAWLLDPEADGAALRSLVRGRPVLATAAGRAALVELSAAHAGQVDAAATVAAVREEIDALQAAFEAEVSSGGRSLVRPDWPEVPQAVDPAALDGAAGDDGTGVALGLARWLTGLADAWQLVERRRLARPFLRSRGGESHRALPLVLETGSGEATGAGGGCA